MLKKILKITGVFFLVVLLSAFAIPYFFKDQIKEKIKQSINNNLDANVAFTDADISLFKNFPKASVTVNKLAIINKAPFAGDTLIAAEQVNLKMSVMELFNKENEPMNIEAFSAENGLVNIIFNKDGLGNYDIALKDQKEQSTSQSKPLALKINEYSVENLKFKFTDEASKIRMVLDSINHTGKGDFTNDVLDLDTETTTKITLDMDKVNYMRNVALSLDAVLGVDLKNSKYTFKENKAKINELPLEFDGFIQMVEAGQQYDLKFKTPTSSFKNFLGLIPESYRANIKDVKTEGDFTVSGFAKGLFSDKSVPKFNIELASNNASFQYPNLPKGVKNIVIDTKIINETGVLNDTYVNLDKLSFAIDQDVFSAKANIKNVAVNALVDAALKGTLNLGNLSKAYPIKLQKPLQGILKADVTTKFDMASVEKSEYSKIYNAGTLSLSGFKYVDENGKSMNIQTALVQFNPSRVNLQDFKATTGKSDIQVSGVLENFYGFIFRNQNLQGNFNMNSNQIAVSDFMTTAEPTKETNSKTAQAMKIPAFLDCSLTAKANTVLYDNLTLKNVSGKLIVKDQKVTMQNVKTNIFNGAISLNGDVSTKGKTPVFDMDLGLNQVDIAQTCSQLDMMKKIIPIAGIINGKLNSTIKLAGNLNATEMTPDLNTLSGNILGQLLSTTVNSSNSTLLSKVDDQLGFVDLKKLNLNDLKAAISFDKGRVTVKPIDIKYQDIKATIGGTHGFDQSMKYDLKLDVPAKYLGTEVNNALAKLTQTEVSKLGSIPINGLITGSFSNPKVTTDVKQQTTSLVTNLVKVQKEKLVGKGKSELEKLIDKNKKPGDTTKTKIPTTKEEIKEKAKEEVKNKTKDLLNGLFKKKE
ncbi:AsmA-like protein [Flavobacterium croceum DSM 17960]|uniref:AsmA-like protein n=1 Tax=Flavobacterium croceum DSM 17960 TaxID=1121886 RepID=A0A2S4N728_9FLAO|nr:AsmA-like C-terminal region-containing protein [Flavobacterium croceum]POS01487.1 AsmA-like protein [Flavobacterium croceum DSM 17960]